MTWSDIDWKALERLRAGFLAGTAGAGDYWQNESDLASYDATFAQRIGWKWDYVLAELQRRGWSPAPGALLDWGCGSGIAHRAYLDVFGADTVSELRLWDRSALAMRFAEKRAAAKYPGLKILSGPLAAGQHPSQEGNTASETTGTTLLISHVLTELQPAQVESLVEFAAHANSVIWVEPGTYEASLTLIAVRERLRERMNVIAPCLHAARCGILAPENERHWCHHFASPPPFVFTDGNWARFSEFIGVDLRDLPVSFLVLDRRPVPSVPPGAVRVIGHARVYKPHALLLGCDASGVAEKRLTKRRYPRAWRDWKNDEGDPLQVWRCEEDEIVDAAPLPNAGQGGDGDGTS
jgi:ribosomal protein RSM22 (predicted rRNA methylase)